MAKKKINWDEMKVERRERSKHEGSTFERVFAIVLTGIFVMPLWALVHAIRWDTEARPAAALAWAEPGAPMPASIRRRKWGR